MGHDHLRERQARLHVYDELDNETITKLIGLTGVLFAENARGADKCR